MPRLETLHFVFFVAVFLHGSAAFAAGPRRVAVVALDEIAASRGLDVEAARVLEPTGMVVLLGDDLAAAVSKREQPAPAAETLEQFAPATQEIATGVERFFYKSPERAIPMLEPVIDIAWHHPEVLAFRPDLADQIWQAGVVLVRAYLATGGPNEAELRAVRLITLLPTREVDPKVVPPDTRAVLESARKRIAAGGATLRLSSPEPQRCSLYLNGAPAEPKTPYVVDPSGHYFARADCSEPTTPPVWRAIVEQDRDIELLVPPQRPLEATSETLNDRGRRVAEWYLEATAALAHLDAAVGVASSTDDDSVVLVRYDRTTQTFAWSDSDYASSIRRGMPRIFPEYAAAFAEDAAVPPQPKRIDWTAVSFLGGGTAAAGISMYLLISSGRQSRLLDCAVNNPSPPDRVDCSGLRSDLYFDDFDSERRNVNLVRASGYALLGISAAAIGYGVYRLVRPQRGAFTSLTISPFGAFATW